MRNHIWTISETRYSLNKWILSYDYRNMVVKKPTKTKKPRTKLTLKQERFVDKYTKSWNATEAAAKVYKVKNRTTASAIWTENLWKPLIVQSIQERVKMCKDIIFWLAMNAKKDEVKINAAKDVIDRVEWKATIKIGWDDSLPFTVTIVNYGNKTDSDTTQV